MATNLAVTLADAAGRDPERVAIRLDDRALTYRELDAASSRFAGHLLAEGVSPGDRVALMLPNCPEFAVAYYGVLRAGAVVVPINVLLKRREIVFYLRDSGAVSLVAGAAFAAEAVAAAKEARLGDLVLVGEVGEVGTAKHFSTILAAHEAIPVLVQRDPDDTAVILYTSGTTGTPKGAQLTHFSMLMNAQCTADMLEVRAGDQLFGALPLFHVFGQTCVLNASMRRRATAVLMERFEPEAALDLIERGITVMLGVPTMYVALANSSSAQNHDFSSVRAAVSGGAPLPVGVLSAFEQRFGCRILEGYGLSEVSSTASFNHPDRPSKPGSIGTPIWGTEMRVVGEHGETLAPGTVGEIVIRGHNVMSGYHNQPEATAEAFDHDGWFHSGDLAYADKDGYFFVVDRKKDIIIRGGYNVYPREIEEVLYEHPGVLEAAVIGVPDDRLGEEVAAFVVGKPQFTLETADVIAFARERMAAYKYPRILTVVDALPKGPTGKILKRQIDLRAAVGRSDRI